MAANATPISTSTIIKQLQRAFPQLHFACSDDFYWSPAHQTVFYRPVETHSDICAFLHETAHALLKHQDFSSDIALLGYENQAWQHARDVVAPQFDVTIDDRLIDDYIETYREWLHARSRCPACTQTGLQTAEYTYECVNCGTAWTVNDARTCGLRRRVTAPAPR